MYLQMIIIICSDFHRLCFKNRHSFSGIYESEIFLYHIQNIPIANRIFFVYHDSFSLFYSI